MFYVPAFITGLLHNIGTHVDPIILIQKIREGLKIPGLRDSLVKILQDYNLQVVINLPKRIIVMVPRKVFNNCSFLQISLREGCKKILVSDCFGLIEKLTRTQRRGVNVEEKQMCQACQDKLIVSGMFYNDNFS